MTKFSSILLAAMLVATPKTHALAAETSNHKSVTLDESIALTIDSDATIRSQSLGFQAVVAEAPKIQVATASAPKNLKEIAAVMVTERFGAGQFSAFDSIIFRESSWNPNAVNAYSGACGLGQALPCSKMHDMTPKGQLAWTIDYIANRYGTPNNAWAFWQQHGWY